MSSYNLSELLHKWAKGELTPEQAIGQLVQHVFAHGQRLSEIEKRLRQVEQPPGSPGKQ